MENKKNKFWKFINSAIGIWIFTTVVGGYGVWQFEKYIDQRKRTRELQDKYQKLSLEYEGRLSQYSSWFLTITSKRETDSLVTRKKIRILTNDKKLKVNSDTSVYMKIEEFKSCVSSNYLRKSIKLLSGAPNLSNFESLTYQNDSCQNLPTFQAVFDEYSSRSTIGLLAEMRLINQELFPISYDTDPDDGATYVSKNNDAYLLNNKILNAINSFLNPDAIVPENESYFRDFSVEKFRKEFSNCFYGFGPAELWYGDVFAG